MKTHMELSAAQESTLGKCLYKFYYQRNSFGLKPGGASLRLEGYPHNGGEHTLYGIGEKEECVAFLQLFGEEFPTVKEMCDSLIASIQNGATSVKPDRKWIRNE